MSWTEQSIDDWKQFSDALDNLRVESPLDQSIVFRGQSNSQWSLLPKICRGDAARHSPQRIIKVEEQARKEFASQAHLHLPLGVLPKDESTVLNWWFLMQQHNAPTRLLDWSESPYVAAYFAVVENWSSDGVIWCFDQDRVNEFMTSQFGDNFAKAIDEHIDDLLVNPDAPEMLFTITRFKKSSRMVAQQGLSTLCTSVLADHEEVIPRAFSHGENSATCMKLTIPSRCKRSLLIHLRSMNITAASLFPGIDGLGHAVQERALLSFSE